MAKAKNSWNRTKSRHAFKISFTLIGQILKLSLDNNTGCVSMNRGTTFIEPRVFRNFSIAPASRQHRVSIVPTSRQHLLMYSLKPRRVNDVADGKLRDAGAMLAQYWRAEDEKNLVSISQCSIELGFDEICAWKISVDLKKVLQWMRHIHYFTTLDPLSFYHCHINNKSFPYCYKV